MRWMSEAQSAAGRSLKQHCCNQIAIALLGSSVLILGGCAIAPDNTQQSLMPPRTAQSPTPSSPSVSETLGETETATTQTNTNASPTPTSAPSAADVPTATNGPTTTVTIYKADDQCLNYVPQRVKVSAESPIEGAVGKVLGIEGDGAGEFDMSGFRVSVNEQTGVATVDLRMNPASKRGIVSLSACEQFALFGSLRETLIKNPQWKIRTVRFTERGQEIVL